MFLFCSRSSRKVLIPKFDLASFVGDFYVRNDNNFKVPGLKVTHSFLKNQNFKSKSKFVKNDWTVAFCREYKISKIKTSIKEKTYIL